LADIFRRLTQTIPQIRNPRLRRSEISFVPDPNNPLSGGIISHLTTQCGGNVHEAGIVTATASSAYDTATTYHDRRISQINGSAMIFTKRESVRHIMQFPHVLMEDVGTSICGRGLWRRAMMTGTWRELMPGPAIKI
jgi:hypothetical protein